MTIMIRTDIVVLLAERIHSVPMCRDRIVLSCAVVVGIQSVHPVELLAVVLVGLDAVVRCAVAELCPEGIVVHRLDDAADTAAVGFRHLTDVAEVVTVIVAERELVLAGIIDVALRLAVAFLKDILFVDTPEHDMIDACGTFLATLTWHLRPNLITLQI